MRRFPKRVWLVNNASQKGRFVEVCREPKTADAYRTEYMREQGWEVVEYVLAEPCMGDDAKGDE